MLQNAAKLPRPDHIGIVVKDIQGTVELLSAVWGVGPWKIQEYAPSAGEAQEGRAYRIKLAFAELGPIRLELIQPLEGKSLWSEFLDNRGEGMQHIGFMISNWDDVIPGLATQEDAIVAGGIIGGGKRWRYYETRPGGILIQLEEPGGVFLESDVKK